MWKCRNCGAENPDKNRFCEMCGTRRGEKPQSTGRRPYALPAALAVLILAGALVYAFLINKGGKPTQPARTAQPVQTDIREDAGQTDDAAHGAGTDLKDAMAGRNDGELPPLRIGKLVYTERYSFFRDSAVRNERHANALLDSGVIQHTAGNPEGDELCMVFRYSSDGTPLDVSAWCQGELLMEQTCSPDGRVRDIRYIGYEEESDSVRIPENGVITEWSFSGSRDGPVSYSIQGTDVYITLEPGQTAEFFYDGGGRLQRVDIGGEKTCYIVYDSVGTGHVIDLYVPWSALGIHGENDRIDVITLKSAEGNAYTYRFSYDEAGRFGTVTADKDGKKVSEDTYDYTFPGGYSATHRSISSGGGEDYVTTTERSFKDGRLIKETKRTGIGHTGLETVIDLRYDDDGDIVYYCNTFSGMDQTREYTYLWLDEAEPAPRTEEPAAEPEDAPAGNGGFYAVGENGSWDLTDDGLLTIHSSEAWDYEFFTSPPWRNYRDWIAQIVVDEGVTSVREYAFAFCTAAESVRLPADLKTIGFSAFQQCAGLKSIDLPSGLETIGDGAFLGCDGFESVCIPEGVNTIGEGCFACCENLREISVSEKNRCFIAIDGVLFTRDMKQILCYPKNKTGQEYTVPVGVVEIGGSAFRDCDMLESVVLSEGVRIIRKYAFIECDGLREITLPKSLGLIWYTVFYESDNLTDVYYNGTKAQWDKITISIDNENLLNANIHYK